MGIVASKFWELNVVLGIEEGEEMVSREEAMRRQSMEGEEGEEELTSSEILPDMVGESQLLTDEMIITLSNHLPARTIGNPWRLIYSTEQHGFSLKTLYRDMAGIDSPVLLVVKDTNQHVFGALASEPFKQSDTFYGSGETFLFTFYPEFTLYRWTGVNNFHIKGNLDSLGIGCGEGLFGLWLDGDLFHGRTHRCSTYDNDSLTATEDFFVKGVEAWAFMSEDYR